MVKINEYKTYEVSDCFLGCIQNYLLLYQNLVDECNIFFEGNGFDLTYILNEDDKYSIKFKAHINESVYKYCDKYGVKLQKKKFKDIKVADKELLEDLKKNHIVIKLNAENLKYNDVFKYSFSVTHYINLLSYDFNKNRAYISDGFIPKYPREIYQGWYNYKDLRYAREKVEYEYIVVEKDSLQDIYEKLNKCEVNKRLYNCVIDNIRRYIRGGKDKDAYHGIDAIEHFIDKISGLVVDDAEEFSKNIYKIHLKLGVNGFINIKSLLAKTILKLGQEFTDKNLIKMSEELQEIYEKWIYINRSFIKCSISKRQKDIDIIAERMNKLFQTEYNLYKKLLLYMDKNEVKL